MTSQGKTMLKKKLSVKERIEPFYLGGSVAYSSDGSQVYCQFRNQIKLLSVESGKQIGQYGTEDDEELTCFALSPDDKLLVSASRGLLMVQWDPQTATPTRTWKSAHQLPVEVLTFDPTSTLLSSGGADGTVKIYDMVHSYCTHNLRIHKGVVKLVKFHPDISRLQLFTSSGDFKIRIWNLQTSEMLAVLDKHFSLVTSIAFSRTGNLMFSSSCDRVLVAWNLSTYNAATVTALSEDVRAVIALPAGSLKSVVDPSKVNHSSSSSSEDLALCVGSSGKLRIVDPLNSQILYSQKESLLGGFGSSDDDQQVDSVVSTAIHLSRTNTISIVSNFHHIFHASLDDLSTPKKVFMGNNDEVLSLRLINDDALLAVVTNSPDIKLYEVESFSCRLLQGHEKTVLGIDNNEKRRLLASVSKDATCRIWSYKDADNIFCVAVASGHAKSIIACAFSRLTGSFVVTGGEDMSLKSWKISSKLSSTSSSEGGRGELKKLKSIFTAAAAHSKDVNSIALSPNDKFVATASQDKTAKLWSGEDGKLLGIFSGHRRGVWCVNFSPVDQIIATSSADGTLKLWALSEFSCIKSIDAHDASVLNLAFVTRGMQIVSAGADGLIKLWTIKNSECAGSFDLHDAKIWALETAADGLRVITGAADGQILFLDDVTELEEIEEAGKRESKILQDQSLANCLHQKDYTKGFLLALDLNRPRDLLKISNSLLCLPDWRPRLESILARLRPEDQIEALLSHVKAWNANGRTCNVAQTLLELLLRVRDVGQLAKDVPNVVGIVESLTPFTQRHYDRLQLLTQQATFLDYLWNSMKLDATEDVDGGGIGEAEDEESGTRGTDDSKMDPEEDDEEDEGDSDSGVMDADSGAET